MENIANSIIQAPKERIIWSYFKTGSNISQHIVQET